MKKLLLLVLLVFSLSITFSQTTFPITQIIGSPQTLVLSKGGLKADSSLIIPSFTDTISANLSSYVKKYPGNIIRAGNQVYVRSADTSKWLVFAQSGAVPGTVTSISQGYGISNTPNPIISTGTIKVDTSVSGLSGKYVRIADTSAMLSKYLRKSDTASLSNRINLKVNISDTSAMLSKYLRKVDTASLSSRIDLKVNISDTSAMLSKYLRKSDTTLMLSPYLRKIDTASLSNRINLKVNISDTSTMLSKYLRKIDTASLSNRINLKVNISDTSSMLSPYLRKIDTSSLSNRINLKVNISDTSTMLSPYLRKYDTTAMLSKYLRRTDTTAMLSPYLRKIDTTAMLSPYLRKADTTNRFVNRIERTPGKDSIIFYVGATRYAIKDSTGGSGTVTRAVDTIYRTAGKDSIIFTIAGVRRAIKDSVGSGGGGGTPAGSNGYVQFNSSGSFGADSSIFWNNTNKRLGLGTTQPRTKLDVSLGKLGNMPYNYEIAAFSKDADAKFGVYNADNYNGSGASITLGNIKNLNANERYPGFEFQNVNDSETFGNSYVRYNYLERGTDGNVAAANVDLFNIYADGRVIMSPYSYSLSASPRLIIGSDNTGANFEVSGNAYIGSGLVVDGPELTSNAPLRTSTSRYKSVIVLDDNVIGNAYYIQGDEHIIIYNTNLDNAEIYLPAYPDNGRELVIKKSGVNAAIYNLFVNGNGHDIWYGEAAESYRQIPDTPPHSMTLIYDSGTGYWYQLTEN